MSRAAPLLALAVLLGTHAVARPQGREPPPRKPLPDGIYAVERDGPKEKEVLPLRDGEVLLTDRHRYLKTDNDEPPRFLVVRSAPDVALDLAAEPKAIKKDGEVVGVSLQLRPKAAEALERLTRDRLGKQVAIVVGGDVVTVHKVRSIIKGGAVQITSCAPKAAGYLLEQLEARRKSQ
jgi:preprotein translocase subunit SecD